MRHTEFWARMESALGPVYARTWAREHVVKGLEQRTVMEALVAADCSTSAQRIAASSVSSVVRAARGT